MLGVLAASSLLSAACSSSDDSDRASEAPTIVATTSIWADVASNIACDGLATVEVLIPTGGDPHAFEPSLADRGEMADASVLVVNGLGLEEGLVDTIDAVEAEGTPVVRVAEYAGVTDDPHIWLDPTLVSMVLPGLAQQLIESGIDADAVQTCLDSYLAELAALDDELVEILASVPADQRKLVTSHDALGYFAERYEFAVIGTVIPVASGLAETNPAQLEELAALIEEAGVGAVFTESQHSADDAEALADRVGDVAVVTLFTGTLGDAESGADTYIGLLRVNAELVADALS